MNIDAHLDVRPLLQPGDRLHSGSPFRQLLEDPRFHTEGGQAADTSGRFFEYAVQGHQCSAEHVAYARSKGTQFYWLTKDLRKPGADPIQIFRELLLTKENFFVSFDLDRCVRFILLPSSFLLCSTEIFHDAFVLRLLLLGCCAVFAHPMHLQSAAPETSDSRQRRPSGSATRRVAVRM